MSHLDIPARCQQTSVVNRLLMAVFLALATGAIGAAPSPPNVILVLVDDLGWADTGCYGSQYYKTPSIDRLASRGVRFTDAYAACPVCSPTRAALLTGKYPARLRLTDWLPGRGDRPDQPLSTPTIRQQLPLEEITLAEALREAGYATAHIGKWHLGGSGFGPKEQGFDLNVAGDETGSPRSYFAPFRGKAREGKGRAMPGLEKAIEGEYLTDRLTTEAIRFIDGAKERPFFLYLAHYAVHIPLRAKQELIEHYPIARGVGQQTNAIYAAMIESVDAGLGRILARLEELELSERTIVVFTSDNGGLATLEGPATPATINSPLREGKGYLYEGGIRVPLIVTWPGNISAEVSAAPSSSIDLFPTLLELCGVKTAAERDGVSLVSALKGGELSPRPLFWHYPHYSNQGGNPGGAIRLGPWKLIEFYGTGRRELFNVARDPGESQNRAEEEVDRVEAMASQLEQWRHSMQAQSMTPNADYHPNRQRPDGTVVLPARWAEVHGRQLRYEPLPHKSTLGYWTRVEDWASWEFELDQPGRFAVELMQGCGTGQGGSEVIVTVGGQNLSMTVEDTGHFQNFKSRVIGEVAWDKPGRYQLIVKPHSKARGAVMDLRQVVLRRKS